jgi:hypothetical protein
VQRGDGTTRQMSAATAYLYTKFWNGTAFNADPYTYSPLGTSRSIPASILQAAIWYTEGVSSHVPTGSEKLWVDEAIAATTAGGSWASLYGTAYPGCLGNVRALNITKGTGASIEYLQDVLVLIKGTTTTCDCDCTGYTPGFWHNKNGLALIKASGVPGACTYSWINTLNAYHLRDASGANQDFAVSKTGAGVLSDWLVSGNNAVNMAQKLSQHVAAMALNVLRGEDNAGASRDCLVYTGTSKDCLNGRETITIGEVLDLAEASLTTYGYTPSGHAQRSYQECLKNILDAANNNLNWVNQ